MRTTDRIGILFVCMGNICRSPLAEGVFRHHAARRGASGRFLVDSAGTGDWHVGEPPDERMVSVARSHGVVLAGRARQVAASDFARFDHLVCMDQSNLDFLEQRGAPEEKLRLLLAADPASARRDVPDPYYGDADGFETVFTLVERACAALLDELLDAGSAGPR